MGARRHGRVDLRARARAGADRAAAEIRHRRLTGNFGYYGSILLALFLLGWGLSMVWGPIGDRFGRVRALMLTILCYSLFTFLCGLVTNIWQLAVLRVLVRHRHRR